MQKRLRIPISLKLVAGAIALVLAVVVPIALESSEDFIESFGIRQRDFNGDLANLKAVEMDGLILGYVEKVRMVTNLTLQAFSTEEERRRALDLAFGRDLDIVNLDIYELKEGKPTLHRRETNEKYLHQFGLDKRYVDKLRLELEQEFPVMRVFSDKGKIHVRNNTIQPGAPLFSIGVPFPDQNGLVHHVAIAEFRLDRLQKAFAISGVHTLYVVDEKGFVLAHKDDELAMSGKNLKHVPIVKQALADEVTRKRQAAPFFDPEERRQVVGAYSRTAFGLTVIAQAPEKIILEPAKKVQLNVFKIAGYALSGALFFIIVFSLTLTDPIEKLLIATQMVAKGNFDVVARVRTRDEVGDLAKAFNRMVVGLKERDKVKNILTKFHGSTITDDLLKRDLNLGGTKKDVTVFFSDIRGFTKFSEGHTPEEVVEMLNEYFQIMVSIITRNHGVVDKFVGDAIMAVWGAPNSTGRDAYHAVLACLEMRKALAELNEKRIARGHSEIRIGMGLHSGPAISGTIGSTERMEYTVIGDTVNMASRIESSTKAFGADLLISETVAQDLKGHFVMELAGEAEVKGKSEPIKMYKVRGQVMENGHEVLIVTPYSDYEPEDAEKVKIAS